MAAYVVEQIDAVTLTSRTLLKGMDLMSPYVWREGDRYRILVRGVPYPLGPADPTGIVVAGDCDDGLTFEMSGKLAIVPGDAPDSADAGGCEDPTVLHREGAGYLVYYTGVDANREQGSLLLAAGPDLASLKKQPFKLKAKTGEGNIKEATLAEAPDGTWRLFYEYAANEASRIGLATAPSPEGPWRSVADPFTIREDSWDNWHLSTGPVIRLPGHDPVMFYNGATHDARWRIGWISFDPAFTRVTGRGVEPLLVPPPPTHRDSTDIAFAASTVRHGDLIALYYSLEDRILSRALIRAYG